MKCVAVVEDNADNRLLVQAVLQGQYQIVAYPDGPEALQGLPEQQPDLILLDVSLPAMDGEEVLQELRRNPRLHRVPVVAFTAHAMAGDRERLLGVGFDDYLPKPITAETLLALVDRWI